MSKTKIKTKQKTKNNRALVLDVAKGCVCWNFDERVGASEGFERQRNHLLFHWFGLLRCWQFLFRRSHWLFNCGHLLNLSWLGIGFGFGTGIGLASSSICVRISVGGGCRGNGFLRDWTRHAHDARVGEDVEFGQDFSVIAQQSAAIKQLLLGWRWGKVELILENRKNAWDNNTGV